jgi:small subunit ribosomal protein S13
MADFKHIVRVANTDLAGAKRVMYALRKIKGVNTMFANAVCTATGVARNHKVGELPDADIKKLDEAVRTPAKYKIPEWMYNRKRDPDTGDDLHINGPDLRFQKEQDIKKLKMIKCYRGMRHAVNAPVRGQRTKSNFRSSKRKGGSLGVKKGKGKKGRV